MIKFKIFWRTLAKWLLLVWANAAFSFLVAFNEYVQPIDRIGICCGVITFVVLYCAVDWLLIQRKHLAFSKALSIAALCKLLTQFYPGLELLTGLSAVTWIEQSIGEKPGLSTYLITLLDGVLLSLPVLVLSGLIYWLMCFFKHRRTVTPPLQ